MTEEIKWMYKQLKEKDFYSTEIICGVKFWKLNHTDDGGYSENEVYVYWHKDGAISFSGDSDGAFIYFYPKQVNQLLMALHNFEENKNVK
jgi:hypothetical protein